MLGSDGVCSYPVYVGYRRGNWESLNGHPPFGPFKTFSHAPDLGALVRGRMVWSGDEPGDGDPTYLKLRSMDFFVQTGCGLLAFGGIAAGVYWLVFPALAVYLAFKLYYIYKLAQRFSALGWLGIAAAVVAALVAAALAWRSSGQPGPRAKGALGGAVGPMVLSALLLGLGGLWAWHRRRAGAKQDGQRSGKGTNPKDG